MYCPDKAERVKRFIELHCTYSKGEWAGKPFRLLPWQWDELISPLYGTVNDEGYRQYRTCYCEIPKKNGKTELCAALGLYMLTNDGEEGAEVYVAAADREQASICYQAATSMVANSPELSRHIKRLDSRKRLIYHKKNSFMQVLSSESYTKHGLSPSAVIIDEIHAHPSDELYTVLTAGTDYARRQQVVLVITTAGIYDQNSIWWRLRSKAQQVKAGIVEDPRFLPVLYLADPEKDDPADEELWKRVNPSLGQIFSLDKIRQDYNEAKHNPIDFQNFKRFRLNIPIKQLSKWLPMEHWDKCGGVIDVDSLAGRECYGGVDLSTKIDLTAFVLIFPPTDDDCWRIIPRFYVPESTITERSRTDAVPYGIWAEQGFICATPGNVIDHAFIEADIIEASKKYELKEIGFDPWMAMEMMTRLSNDYGITTVEMRQGTKTLSEPAKELLVKVMRHQIIHGKHPVLRWCMDNLVMDRDANENIRPNKEKATDRIDGAVALVMALGRALFAEKQESPYTERGIMVL